VFSSSHFARVVKSVMLPYVAVMITRFSDIGFINISFIFRLRVIHSLQAQWLECSTSAEGVVSGSLQ